MQYINLKAGDTKNFYFRTPIIASILTGVKQALLSDFFDIFSSSLPLLFVPSIKLTMSDNPQNINQTVLRGAKQIYTHLRLKERIALLSNTPLPVEVIKLQTLLARTNKGMVENTVRKFISWNAPNKRPKTLEDFLNLVDEHCKAVFPFFECPVELVYF